MKRLADSNNPAADTAKEDRNMAQAQTMELSQHLDPLLTVEDVASRLNVSKDWVWDHSSRKLPYLPVIRMSDGTLRYRASRIEEFIDERERASVLRRKRR
jgi:predicted DNA-binding transcriptional regulator AlpA